MLTPKYTPEKCTTTTGKQFTDREEFLTSFHTAMENSGEKHRVLVFYGVGGIGKTGLLKEMRNCLKDRHNNYLYAVLDFKTEIYREQVDALFVLRESLKKSAKETVAFPVFDIAYAVYRKKIHPHLPVTTQELPYLEEGGLVAELLSTCGDIPIIGLLPSVAKLIYKGIKKYEECIVRSCNNDLANIQKFEASQLYNLLPYYWAQDIKRYLVHKKAPAVFFLDSYEKLWKEKSNEIDFFEKDEWIRELIINLPEILWVICGQEKLRWNEIHKDWSKALQQHLVGSLSNEDSEHFLVNCSIGEAEIRQLIIRESKGVPCYLNLSVDTYYEIKNKLQREPVFADFIINPREILGWFLHQLSIEELATIKILAVPRFWDYDLFSYLIIKFMTGYPQSEHRALFRFSFIFEDQEHVNWSMHELVRSSLVEILECEAPSLYRDVHGFILNYYEKHLNSINPAAIQQSHRIALSEAFFHGSQILNAENLFNWLKTKATDFKSGGQWDLLVSLYENMLTLIPMELNSHAFWIGKMGYELADLYRLQGKYGKAKLSYKNAIDIGLKLRNVESRNVLFKFLGDCYQDLAELCRTVHEYEQAILNFDFAMYYYNNLTQEAVIEVSHSFAVLLIRLGKLQVFLSRNNEARKSYLQAIDKCLLIENIVHDNSAVFSTLGLAEERLGEVYAVFRDYEAAGNCYNRAIVYYDISIENTSEANFNNPDYIATVHNKAVAYKRLAEYYGFLGDNMRAIDSFRKSIGLYEDVLGISLNFIEAYKNKGHAAVDLMVLQVNRKLYSDAIASYEIAREAFKCVNENSPEDSSAYNRMGSANRALGDLYMGLEDYEVALSAYEQALYYVNQGISISPEYVYAYSSKGETYQKMGLLYIKKGDRQNACEAWQKAIQCFEEVLSRTPGAEYAKELLEESRGLLSSIGL